MLRKDVNNVKFSSIKLVVSDCDGVLTDGGMYYTESGEEFKRFNALDGVGFLLLKEYGIKTAILTASNNELIRRRAEKLRIDYLIMGREDKLIALQELSSELDISLANIAYIGDDIYDASAIELCGFGCAPSNAHISAKEKAIYITERTGGEGCFREIADLILKG